MKGVKIALTAGYELAWKCGLIVIAVSLLMAMTTKDRDDSPYGPSASAAVASVSKTACDTTRVIMDSAPGSFLSNCSLVDTEGNELLLVSYSSQGCLAVRWGKAFPTQPGCTASLDGGYSLDVLHERFRYSLRIRPDGLSGVAVADTDGDAFDGLGVTTAGEIVREPSILP